MSLMARKLLMGRTTSPTIVETTDAQHDSTNGDPQSVTIDIGTAFTGRTIVAGIAYAGDMAPDPPVLTVTIGGVSATEIFTSDDPGGDDSIKIGFWARELDTGTTTTVVVSASNGDSFRLMVNSWALRNIQSLTPTYTSSGGSEGIASDEQAFSVDIEEGGIGLGVAYGNYVSGGNGVFSGASKISASGETVNGTVTNNSADFVWTGLTEGPTVTTTDTSVEVRNMWCVVALR